jgi:hypothetical protein
MSQPLPPFGQITTDNQNEVLAHVQGLALDYFAEAAEFIRYAEVGDDIYVWGDSPRPDPLDDSFRINEIQNEVLSQQPLEPAKITLAPVELGEPGVVYFVGGPEKALALAMPQQTLDPATGAAVAGDPLLVLASQQVGQGVDKFGDNIAVPLQPATPEQGKLLTQLVDAGMLEADDIVEVNDQSNAKFWQTVFDTTYTASRTATDADELLLAKSVHGFKFAFYGFDDEQKTHDLLLLSLRQVFMDPTQSRLDKSAYAGVILQLDRNEALRRYPKFSASIKAGQPKSFSPFSGVDLPDVFNRDNTREMSTLTIAWLRDQAIPLSPEEAIAGQQVSIGQLPTEEKEPLTHPDGQAMVDTEGAPMMADVLREAYLGTDGEEVIFGDEGWPVRRGIRQLTFVDQECVEDKECEFWDIPLILVQNIPIPGKPFGIGEPIKLIAAQRALNKTLDNIRINSDWYKYPTLHVPQSTFESMKKAGLKLHAKPGGVIIYEDDVWASMGGKPPIPSDPPQIPPSLIQAEGIFRNSIHEDSARGEAARGNMPSSSASGKTVGLLLQANQQVTDIKGKSVLEAFYRLGMLQLHSLVTRLETADLTAIVSRYPAEVVAAFQDWGRRVQWNMTVNVSMGGSSLQYSKNQNEVALFQAQLQTKETTQLALNIDSASEERREEKQLQRQQRLAAAFAPPMAAGSEKENANGPSANAG